MDGTDKENGSPPPRKPRDTVLRALIARRDGSGRMPPDPMPSAARDHHRAAAIAAGRAAEQTHHLPIFADKVQFAPMSVPEMTELLPDRPLLALVEDSASRIGFVSICPEFLASMIEMQALGRVTPRPARPRRPTRTDAAIAAEFVNALLAELGRELPAAPDMPAFADYRYVAYLDDPRPLALMLEDGEMTRLSLNCRIGSSGQRNGRLLIGLPDSHQRRSVVSAPPPAVQAPPPCPETTEPAIPASMIRQIPITLSAVLWRRKMSLQAIRALEPGSTILLPKNILNEVRVETQTGQLFARGRLGENYGFHSIRLHPAKAEAAEPAQPPAMDAAEIRKPTEEPPLDDLSAHDPFRPNETESPEGAADPPAATG